MCYLMLRRFVILGCCAALAVVLSGCLKFPIGDPETAKVDPALVGDWLKSQGDGAVTIWSVRPFDSRTYLVAQYNARPDNAGGWERGSMAICKAWLTTVGGQHFACLQLLSDDSDKPYVVLKYELTGEALTAAGVDPEFIEKASVDNAAAMVKLIEDNLTNPKLFLDVDQYQRADDADRETVNAIKKAFH